MVYSEKKRIFRNEFALGCEAGFGAPGNRRISQQRTGVFPRERYQHYGRKNAGEYIHWKKRISHARLFQAGQGEERAPQIPNIHAAFTKGTRLVQEGTKDADINNINAFR